VLAPSTNVTINLIARSSKRHPHPEEAAVMIQQAAAEAQASRGPSPQE
jgi:hypothetical protein